MMPLVTEYLSSYSFDPKNEVCSCLHSSPQSVRRFGPRRETDLAERPKSQGRSLNFGSRKRKLYTSSFKINATLRRCVFSYYLVLECLTNRSNYSKSIATYFEYQFLTTVSKPPSWLGFLPVFAALAAEFVADF